MSTQLRTIRLKNTTTSNITLIGITFPPDVYISIESSEVMALGTDDKTFQKIASGQIIVNKGEDILEDIPTPTEAWKWIEGNEVLAKLDYASEVGDKKLWVHSTPKPEFDNKQFFATWAGRSDLGSPNVGGGPIMKLVNTVGSSEQTLDIEFDSVTGDVYVHQAILSWYRNDLTNASIGEGNQFNAYIVSKPTVMQQMADLHYILDGTKVRMSPAGPGTGTHGFGSTPALVPNYMNLGAWDYNLTDGLVPSMDNTGYFDICTDAITVMSLTNSFSLCPLPVNNFTFGSGDNTRIHPGYIIRLNTQNVSNTDWTLVINLAMFRERTI